MLSRFLCNGVKSLGNARLAAGVRSEALEGEGALLQPAK